jgi:hypothetical protein
MRLAVSAFGKDSSLGCRQRLGRPRMRPGIETDAQDDEGRADGVDEGKASARKIIGRMMVKSGEMVEIIEAAPRPQVGLVEEGGADEGGQLGREEGAASDEPDIVP